MRFYSGFSFKLKWRHLKWLAIPLFAILSYFSGVFGFIQTYAYNMNTYYNVDMFDYKTYLENSSCGGSNLYDFLNNYINSIDWSNSQNQVFIGINLAYNHTPNDLRIYFIPTTSVNGNQGHKIWTFGYNQSSGWGPVFKAEASKQYVGSLVINKDSCNNTTNLQSVLDFITTTANTGAPSNSFYTPGFNYSSGSGYYSLQWANYNSFTDSSSYNVGGWWYYSSYDLYMASSSEASGSNKYWKTIHINDNDTNYTFENKFPSYYDLYYVNENETSSSDYFIGSKNSLGTIYTNFDPSYINHFDLDISFNTNINYISGYDYYQNIDFTDINCYGRINHNDNYYSYEKFSYCTFELDTDNLIVSSNNDLVEFSIENLEIYNSNDIKITDFSNYDKIFIYLDFQYDDDSLNTYVSNLQFSSSMTMLYLDYIKGEIFDDFDLPSFFKMFITNTGFSNAMSSNISVRSRNSFLSSNNFLYSQPYSTTTLEPTQVYGFISTNFQNLSVNNSQNLGYMIYHQINNLNLNATPHLDMILMRDIIVSFRNISSNDFYYADDTGTITNNNIEVDYSYGVEESFGDITGLLPPGPLDSLLNIPFKYLSKTINSLNETCSPLSIPFVFDSELTFPCFDTYYEEFPSSLKIFTDVVPCAFILIFYFKHLYKKISRATTLETTENDEWGCL